MSEAKTNDGYKEDSAGMSLRDYFAAKVMQSCLINQSYSMDDLAKRSYAMADAMLKAREAK